MAKSYFYRTITGSAYLTKNDEKPILIGRYNNDKEAVKACEEHYNKSCLYAERFGRDLPVAYFL